MKKLTPFLSASLAVHLCGFAAVAMFIPPLSGVAGAPYGDPDRVFVSIISDRDFIPVAPTPSPVDSPEAVDSEKAEDEVTPEVSPEVLARDVPDSPAEFDHTTLEEPPDPEPRITEHEKKQEREQDESSASDPQVASALYMRRAALGSALRDFESLLLAAIRQATFFPKEALKKKRHGQVMVTFSIDKDGKLARVHVVSPSGCQILDRAAMEIVSKASAKFPSFPSSIHRASLTYTVPIRFKEKRN